eukprot:539496_1
MIKAIYDNSKSAIRDVPFITNTFTLKNGVLQGSVLSPVLFAAFIDDMIHQLQNSNKGARSPDPNERIACIFYADDVILTANHIINLKHLIKICETHSNNLAYQFNAKKCKTIIFNDPTITNKYWNQYEYWDKAKLQNEYNAKIDNKNYKLVPMAITMKPIDNEVYCIDIDNNEVKYNLNEIPTKIINSFNKYIKAYKNIQNKPYLIMWDNIRGTNRNKLTMCHKLIKMYGKSLEVVYNLRYLGAQLRTFENDNIVSTKATNKFFLNKLDQKLQLLETIDFNYEFISLADKIRTLKTFYLVYTEIFAQVLDSESINMTEADDKHKKAIDYNINIERFIPEQLSIYTGIPTPTERWEAIKMTFYWKLIKKSKTNLSYMHKWAKEPYIKHYTLYKQYIELKEKYFPNEIREENNVQIEVDPLTEIPDKDNIRPTVIKQQHKHIVNTLNKYHPLKILNYITDNYKAMNIYESEELENYVNKKMVKKYRELFYYFDQEERFCNIC